MSGQLHAPAALSQGKNSRYPLNRRLGGPHNRYGRGGYVEFYNTTQRQHPENLDLNVFLNLIRFYSCALKIASNIFFLKFLCFYV